MDGYESLSSFAAFSEAPNLEVRDVEPEAGVAEATEAPANLDDAESDEGKYSRAEKIRARAEEILSSKSFNYREATEVAIDPDCPIDFVIDLFEEAHSLCYACKNEDIYLEPILSRLQAIVSSSDTSMDVMEYIAFSKQLEDLAFIYNSKGPVKKTIKEIQKKAKKVLKDAKVTPQYKIYIEASRRKKEKMLKRETEYREQQLAKIKEQIESPDSNSRYYAAKNEYCPENILVELATGDPEGYVRVAATKNKNQTPESLRKVARIAIDEHDYEVLETIIEHESCPADLVGKIMDVIQENWEHVYENSKWEDIKPIRRTASAVMLKIEKHPEMPLEAMEEFKIKYSRARSPLDEIGQTAKKKLLKIHLGRAIGISYPNPNYLPTESELSEEEIVKKKQAELEEKRQAELLKQRERTAMVVEMLDALKRAKDLSEKIRDSDFNETYGVISKNRIMLPEKELIITVGDHYEINPKYLPYISLIDFSLVSARGLKVSGIDWTDTNIQINPQEVYGRDLSGARFSDGSIIFGNFEGCNLCGSDISHEYESSGIDKAITDEHTKLPPLI